MKERERNKVAESYFWIFERKRKREINKGTGPYFRSFERQRKIKREIK